MRSNAPRPPLELEVVRLVRGDPVPLLARAMSAPQRDLFPGSWPVPAVVGQAGADFPQAQVGATRTVFLSDATSSQEELLVHERESFSYRGSGFTGVFRLLVSTTTSTWSVRESPEGALVVWRYCFHPLRGRRALLRLVLPAWRRSMSAGMRSLGA
jgi:hypothetical protein